MQINSNEIIAKSFIESMSEMAFLDTIKTYDFDENQLKNYYGVRIKILMPFLHDILVFMKRDTLVKIRDNLISEEIAVISEEEILWDCMQEFLNIFAGRIFQNLSPDLLFELGLPEKFEFKDGATDLKGYTSQYFVTDDGNQIYVAHKLDKMCE